VHPDTVSLCRIGPAPAAEDEAMKPETTAPTAEAHLLRFASLFHPGRGVCVPCDADGGVHLEALSERLRAAYLGAKALVGREYAFPTVESLH
jgi:hypothetical protein